MGRGAPIKVAVDHACDVSTGPILGWVHPNLVLRLDVILSFM